MKADALSQAFNKHRIMSKMSHQKLLAIIFALEEKEKERFLYNTNSSCMVIMKRNDVVACLLPYMREAQKPLSSSRYAMSSSESDSVEHTHRHWLKDV